jgi:uracil-DNA glycosylase
MVQPRYPLAAGDLTGLNARRADVDAVLVTPGAGGNAHGLDVGIPPTAGPAMGVRHRLAEARALSADIADGSHT